MENISYLPIPPAEEHRPAAEKPRDFEDLSRVVASVFHALQVEGVIETRATTNQISALMESVFLDYEADPDGPAWVQRLHGCIRLMKVSGAQQDG